MSQFVTVYVCICVCMCVCMCVANFWRCRVASYSAVRLVLITPLNCWRNSTPFWCKASLCTIKIDNFRTYHIARAYSTFVVLFCIIFYPSFISSFRLFSSLSCKVSMVVSRMKGERTVLILSSLSKIYSGMWDSNHTYSDISGSNCGMVDKSCRADVPMARSMQQPRMVMGWNVLRHRQYTHLAVFKYPS